MGIQNYNFNNLDIKLSSDALWDFDMAFDESEYNTGVIYNSEPMYYSANTTIFSDSFYSGRIPLIMDLNDPDCTLQTELPTITNLFGGDGPTNPGTFFSANTLVSKMSWNMSESEDGGRYYDIGLTGIDNGLVSGLSGYTINLDKTMDRANDFHPLYYDYRMKMHSVTGYTSYWDRRLNGGVLSFDMLSNPLGYTVVDGTYLVTTTNITTSGIGSGIEVQVTVSGGTVDPLLGVVIINQGNSYEVSDSIYIPETLLGGTNPSLLIKIRVGTVTSGVPTNPVTYGMRSNYDRTGFYYDLYGGFFQGFYRLWGTNYDVLENRVDKGWTSECFLKVRSSGSSWNNLTTNTLNDIYPDNEGIFFYLGSRSENKFWSETSSESGRFSMVGDPLYTVGECVETNVVSHVCDGKTGFTWVNSVFSGKFLTSASTEYDVLSNNFALRLSGGSQHGGYKLGYRALRYTGDTEFPGDTLLLGCSGTTFVSGFTIEEKYTDEVICTGTTVNEWVKIDAVWKRNFYFPSEEEKEWRGGTSLISSTVCQTAYTNSYTTEVSFLDAGKYIQNEAWLDDIDNRMGQLQLYVNSRPVLTVDNFEEIIPRRLNIESSKQLGVPFNMSFGGGSQGLYESLTFSGTPVESSVLYNTNTTSNWEVISGTTGTSVTWDYCDINSQETICDGISKGVLLTSENYGVGLNGLITLSIKDYNNYNHPIISGETYDIILNVVSHSGSPSIDIGFSGSTEVAPTPEVTYLFQDKILQSFISGSTFHSEYVATHTGNMFIGISPNTHGSVLIANISVSKREYKRNPGNEGMLIEKHFAGTYMGGISQMRFYQRPLDASEIRHNYYVNEKRYGLTDCNICKDEIFVEGCDDEFAIYTFPIGIDEISLSFDNRMVLWSKFESVNVDTWDIISNYHITPKTYNITPTPMVKFPFTSVPTKPLTVTITRIDAMGEASIKLTGKRVR